MHFFFCLSQGLNRKTFRKWPLYFLWYLGEQEQNRLHKSLNGIVLSHMQIETYVI